MNIQKQTSTIAQAQTVNFQTLEDFKASLLVVSVLVNLTVLTAWLVAQTSSVHAAQLMTLL